MQLSQAQSQDSCATSPWQTIPMVDKLNMYMIMTLKTPKGKHILTQIYEGTSIQSRLLRDEK